MQNKIYEFDINLMKKLGRLNLDVVKGDTNSTTFKMTIYSGWSLYPLNEDMTITLTFKRPDNEIFVASVDNENIDFEKSIVSYTLNTSETDVVGNVLATIEFYKGDKRLTSEQFYFNVIDELNDGTGTPVDTEVGFFNQIIVHMADTDNAHNIQDRLDNITNNMIGDVNELETESKIVVDSINELYLDVESLSSITEEVEITGDVVTVGDLILFDNGIGIKYTGSPQNQLQVAGIVLTEEDGDRKVLACLDKVAKGLSNIIVGKEYYTDPINGGITTDDTLGGIFIAVGISDTELYFLSLWERNFKNPEIMQLIADLEDNKLDKSDTHSLVANEELERLSKITLTELGEKQIHPVTVFDLDINGNPIFTDNADGNYIMARTIDNKLIAKKFEATLNSTNNVFVVAANNSPNKASADYVCDGIADQTEINQAITTALTGGTYGMVVLLAGDYNVNLSGVSGSGTLATPYRIINLLSNSITLTTWGRARIRVSNSAVTNVGHYVNVVQSLDGLNNVRIEGLEIDCNRINNTGRIRGISVDSNVEVINNKVSNSRLDFGIYAKGNSNKVIGNKLVGCLSRGIQVQGQDNDIKFNDISTSEYGIFVDSQNNNIFGNRIYNSSLYGIHVQDHARNRIIKNICYSNAYGINLSISIKTTVMNNICYDNSRGIFNTGDNNNIINNDLRDNIIHAITNSGNTNVIKNNDFRNCGVGLSDTGLNTIIGDIYYVNALTDSEGNIYYEGETINMTNSNISDALISDLFGA